MGKGRAGNRDEAAGAIIARLDLSPHPEGGWYRETWRAPAPDGERASGTAIWFLLEAGQRSHWHRVDAAEIWLWHAGHPLRLSISRDGEEVRHVRLGGDVMGGETPQHVIAPGEWQAAEAGEGWTLVSCVVSPGFDFAGFTLAEPGWAPGG
ncbi:MAG: cupin domain-containing protein [Sphingobium sp.]